jgi:proteic killer suppression protein
MAIQSFADKQTAAVFAGVRGRSLPAAVQDVARRKLKAIDAAASLEDLRIPPGNRLEALTGRRRGQYSIRVNAQWRICFRWHGADATDVAIVDYH